jgi:hypothetical protein
MRRFAFVLNPVVRFPWEILMYLCAVGAIGGAILKNIHAVIPSIAGAFIFFLFYSMKRFSYIFVSDRSIRVRMGVFAFGQIPFSNIGSVETVTHKPIHGIGVKTCGKGEMAMVTTAGEVARLELKQRGTLKMFGLFRVSFSGLRLSPEKQDEFIAMVTERLAEGE